MPNVLVKKSYWLLVGSEFINFKMWKFDGKKYN